MHRSLIWIAVIVVAACGDFRAFDDMSATDRRAVGSAEMELACGAGQDAHEPGLRARIAASRAEDYLEYVASQVRVGDLESHIGAEALRSCLEAEGWRRRVRALVLRSGSDQQVEAIVQSAATPRFFCDNDFSERYTATEAERLLAACHRLGLR